MSDELHQQREAALTAWAATLGPTARPALADLAILAALGPIATSTLAQVLWTNSDALEAQWEHGLRELLSDGDNVSPSPLVPTLSAGSAAAAGTADDIASEGTIVQHDRGPESPEGRLERLQAWARAKSGRPEVAAIRPELLQMVAFQSLNSAADIVARFAGLKILVDPGLAQELAAVVADEATPQAPPKVVDAPDLAEWLESPGTFAPVDWAMFGTGQPRPTTPVLTRLTAGGTALVWQDPVDLGRVRLFRVVTSPDIWPALDPNPAEQVGVTLLTSVTAVLAPSSAVTFVGVWCHAGEDEAAARSTPPVFVAQGQVVWPPRSLTMAVTPMNTVAATFDAPPGASIQVQRFAGGATARFNQAAALDPAVLVGNGFVDPNPPVGDVTYAVYASAELSGGSTEWSAPATGTVTVRVRPTSLPLTVTPNEVVPGTYDISWTAPAHGTVEVYLSPTAPPAGLSDQTRSKEIIRGQGGLTSERLLPYPRIAFGDRSVVQGVAIPDDWARAYFVAAHVMSDDFVGVGPTVSLVLPRPPRHPELIERVDTQIITFAWPAADAHSGEADVIVEVHQGPRHSQELDIDGSQPIESMTKEQYFLVGGIHLRHKLPANGCSLHLFGVIYEGKKPRRSHGVALDYAGITRVAYDIIPVRQDGQPAVPPEEVAGYAVTVESNEVLDAAHFVVVHHSSHLPLSPNETGVRELLSELHPLAAHAAQTLGYLTPGPHVGFVRLFYSPPDRRDSARVAVIDPSPTKLWLGVR